MSRHVLKQIAIALKRYSRRGQKNTFSESSLYTLSKKIEMGSIGVPSNILVSPLRKICRDGEVFT